MPFWECYYHVNWSTKHRASIITASMEGIPFAAIRAKSNDLGCPILALNGTADHIHAAVRIAPSVSVAHWVAQVKGASTRSLNLVQPEGAESFHWQEGYGVLTFGARTLTYVVNYVEGQKEHHRAGTIEEYLEQSGP